MSGKCPCSIVYGPRSDWPPSAPGLTWEALCKDRLLEAADLYIENYLSNRKLGWWPAEGIYDAPPPPEATMPPTWAY